jgi:phytoene dehydrogenase-like protein
MNGVRDLVIVGGGHNGLVAAAFLAKAGLKPLVLERRDIVGGAAVTEELHPGFRCPTLAHSLAALRPDVVAELQLDRHGLRLRRTEAPLLGLALNGPALELHADAGRTAAALESWSPSDARAYPAFQHAVERIATLLADVIEKPPSALGALSAADLWTLFKTGRRIRGIGREDTFRLLRWIPMPAADLVGEWFETDLLKAMLAAPGTVGVFGGPRSAGTGAVLLLRAAAERHGAGLFAEGGPGAVTEAMASAARAFGAEIRTGADVSRILVKDDAVAGVVLADGEEVPATVVLSNADPRRTFLHLLDPGHLPPSFAQRIRNFRCRGTGAKVNLALAELPSFTALAGRDEEEARRALAGRIHVGPDLDYLERAFDAAKYGAYSPEPWIDLTIPSLRDPSLAPEGRHVMSIYVQYAPRRLKNADWESRRDAFADTVTRTLAAYAPDLERLILHRQVITPADLEDTWALSGGHADHGELALDQLFLMRPALGWSRFRTPVMGLYLCGAGTHPGGGVTGACGRLASRAVLEDWKHIRRRDLPTSATTQPTKEGVEL